MSALVVLGIKVRQNAEGLYSLNDVHRAAGKIERQSPRLWAANQQAKDLVAEVQMENVGIPTFSAKAGRGGGTWACDDLLIAYAAWISAKFHLRVIRAFKSQLIKDARDVSHKAAMLKSAWDQRVDLERDDARSFALASLGGTHMAQRRHVKPAYEARRAQLEIEMQRPLQFLLEGVGQ